MAMVTAIRNVSQSIAGDGRKVPNPAELAIAAVARKSIVAKRDIRAGERFSEDNLTTRRPGTGLSPMRWDDLMGAVAEHDVCIGEQVLNREQSL